MVVECALFCVGVIIQITSTHVWQQVAVGRLISGLAVGALSAAVPMVGSVPLPRHAVPDSYLSTKRRQPLLKYEVP